MTATAKINIDFSILRQKLLSLQSHDQGFMLLGNCQNLHEFKLLTDQQFHQSSLVTFTSVK